MPEQPTNRRISRRDFRHVAEYVIEEAARRKGSKHRKMKEKEWAEVDRQVEMEALPREVRSGTDLDWLPNIEMPLQAESLEAIKTDAKSMKFPKSTEWYGVQAAIDEKYSERWAERRDTMPIVDGQQGMQLDQETADTLAKAAVDYHHRLYDFRHHVDLMDTEAIKYGTFAARVVEVDFVKFATDRRGIRNESLRGPAVVPVSIKNLLLDDSQMHVMQEGIATQPTYIRTWAQSIADIRRAARGGSKRGWIQKAVNNLEQPDNEDLIQMLEMEGDISIPRSDGNIFLPNAIATVAQTKANRELIRLRFNPSRFRSYIVGYYQRQDLHNPYGSSPLTLGSPLQKGASLSFNNMMASAELNALPPVAWDGSDTKLQATGGPGIYPGAQWESDDPDSVKPQELGNPAALLQMFIAITGLYERLTAVNDPRRGQPAKSHTSATSAELENINVVARTEDFVTGQEEGPLTAMLYMEYDIIKRVMTSPRSIPIVEQGKEGFVNIAAADLADQVVFSVFGSTGQAMQRQQMQRFVAAVQMHMQMVAAGQQLGLQVPVPNWGEVITELYQESGIANGSRFISDASAAPGGAGQAGQDVVERAIQDAATETSVQPREAA